jgi:hypothetical protein
MATGVVFVPYCRQIPEEEHMRHQHLRQSIFRHIAVSALLAVVVAIPLAATTPSFADTVKFKAALKGSDEVPPNQTTGSGSVTASYDTGSKVLTWDGTYSGLSGPATAAHFHGPADPGKNAGVAVPITPAASPLHGTATLTDAQAADLMAGRWYVNIHTEANKGGELRGQLTKM